VADVIFDGELDFQGTLPLTWFRNATAQLPINFGDQELRPPVPLWVRPHEEWVAAKWDIHVSWPLSTWQSTPWFMVQGVRAKRSKQA